MSLDPLIQFEIRRGGSDTNGGGFKQGASGTDWTLQDNPQYSVTDGVTNGSTTITSASANFGTDVVGNVVYVQGGTGSVAAARYQIISRTNATTIVVDRSTGLTAGTGVTLKVGGALATPGGAAAIAQLANGHRIWWKYDASAYACSTSTAGPAGPILFADNNAVALMGYDVTRGDRTGRRPVYQWTASAPGGATYIASTGQTARQVFANFTVDANSVSNVNGISIANRCSAADCVALNASAASRIGINATGANAGATRCMAQNCTTGFNGFQLIYGCQAISCTTGFSVLGAEKCIAVNGTTGFTLATGSGGNLYRCTVDGAATGFSISFAANLVACLATNCATRGFSSSDYLHTLLNCAQYNSGAMSGTALLNDGFVTVTADPYVNRAGGDYRPNTSANGGALLKAAGIGAYGQTDNVDIGAAQSAAGAATYSRGRLVNA